MENAVLNSSKETLNTVLIGSFSMTEPELGP